MHSAVYAVVRCLSVTCMYCVETIELIIKHLALDCSLGLSSLWTPNMGALNRRGVLKIHTSKMAPRQSPHTLPTWYSAQFNSQSAASKQQMGPRPGR